jgi:hypothetical protein
VAHLGDIPGGGQATLIIRTVILSDTLAGTVFTNTASYNARNVDPGRSNQAVVAVKGPAILPVTGGLLDPRTPQGRLAWGILGAALLAAVYFTRRGPLRRRRDRHPAAP